MEVVQRTGGDSPFGRRDVEEWSRLDELTGMLEHARVQTDQWAGIDAQGGSHKYGKKVVDASKTGDAGKHLQRQQLEVFQSKVAGGAMHMVKTQTSSAWSHHGNRNTTGASTTVSSRTRWSSRSQQQQQTTGGSLEQPAITENFANLELQINPIDVSTLKNKANVGRSGAIGSRRPPSARSRRLSASKSGVVAKIEANTELIQEPPEEMTCEVSNKTRAFDFEELKSNLKLGEILGRRLSKSSSTDDLPVGDNSRESDSDSGSWRRGTRVRRSLQFSTKEDGSSVTPTSASKRHSFVTVESLRDVRSRLKHCDPLFTDDNDMTQNILLKNDDRINNSSGLVRAIEQGTKMASTTTTFGSVSGKTDNLESHDWKRAESETNKTVVTLNEQSEGGMVSPTKKRFNESFAFFRGGYENHKNGSLKNFPARQNLITIPIIFQQELSNEIDKTRFSLRSGRDSETSGEESESLGWASRRQLDGLAPLKRRSWAGDSTLFNNRDEEKTMSLTFSSEQEESVQSFGSNQMKKNKRVEFCKTEVHFAAESGKFNIVETDEKPPPSNNFRRRRRSHPVTENGNDTSPNNSLQVAQKPPLPELRFGDTTYEKQMLTATTKHDVSSATQELTKEKSSTNIALTEKSPEIQLSNGIYKRHSADLTSQDVRARGKSMSEATTLVRSTVTLKIQPPEPSKPSPSINLDPEAGTMELQKLIKSLRPTSASRRSLDSSLLITEEEPLDFSVAERIKLHEDRKVKGFSTKVNMGGTTVVRNSESIWLPGSHEQSNHQEVKSESPAADKQSQVLHSTAFKIPAKESTTTNTPAENRIPLSNFKFEPILRGHGSNGLLISPSLIMQIENLKEPQNLLKTIASSSSSTPTYPVISHFTSLKQLRQMNDVSDDGEDCDAADREVCSLMSPDDPPMPPPRRLTSNASTSPSIASGSWSKMRVVRLNQKFHKFQGTKEQETGIALETAPPRRNYVARVRGAINLDALNEPKSFDSGDEKHDVEESSFNKSPPQLSPSKIVAPIAPVANPRTHSTSNGPSITSISLSYESSQPKILASINSCSKPLVKKETRDTTNIVAPIPLKCVKPIKYPGDSKIDTKTPTCPRLEKVSTFKSSKSESKFSSIGKKEGSPVRLLDITSPTTRAQSPAKRQTRTQSPAHGSKHKKPEFYFGAEVLEVEPRPADDRRRLDNTDDEDVEEAAPARKRGVSPSKRLSAPAAKDDLAKKRSASKERTSTSALIEELTRAADEILQAVNGYDDSVVSSDDEKPRPMMPLPVLKEGVITNEKIVKSTAASRLRKQNIGRTSSTSSVDSVNHENSTPRSTTRTRKTITNGTRACAKVSETTSSSATTRRTRITRKRSDSLTSSKGDEEEAEKANERLKMTKIRKATTTSSGQDTVSSTRSSKVVAKPEASVRTRAPVERIIPPANKKGATKSRKDDMFQSNRVINGATAERRLQLLESSCSGSGLRSDSSPGAKRHQHRTVRNAPLKVSAK